MNEFFIIESKNQHKNLLFILHLNFNKLETSLLLAPISTMKSPWKISLPWEMQRWTQGGLGQSFTKCLWSSQLKYLTFIKSCFAFFLMLVPCSLGAFPCHHETLTYLNPLLFVLDLVPIIWSNIWFLGDIAFNFTLATQMTFVLHALHHLHEALATKASIHARRPTF